MFLRLVMAYIGCACACQADIWMSATNAFASVGQTVSVDVNVNSISDLFAYQFDLKFDPTVVQALSVSEGDFLSAGGPTLFFPGSIDNMGGLITFNADTLEGSSGVSGSGTLASFEFVALENGSTSIAIQNAVLLDSTLAGMAFNVSDGNVVVATPEPAARTLLLLCAACVWFGRSRRSASRR